MANASILLLPRDVLFSSDQDAVIGFIIKLLKNPDDRLPLYMQWAYVAGHAITGEEMEALVQLSAKDLLPPSS
jgi:hypothetical protein